VHRFKRAQWSIIAILIAALGAASSALIDTSPVTQDAAQNLQMAVNLSHHGIMSLEETPPYERSMYREPFPIAVSALIVTVNDQFHGKADATEYFAGERVKFVKYQNILWLILLFIAVLAATRWLTDSWLAAVVAGVLAMKPFLGSTSSEGVNNLYTELPAAVLLTFGSLALAAAVIRRRTQLYVAAGLCFGLLALTKSAAVYVFCFLAFVLLIGASRAANRPQRRTHMLHVALMVVSFAAVVGPWIGRNTMAFGRPQVSLRGGLAIYTRALMDQMTPTEYRGAFYAWSRPEWRTYMGRLLGFTTDDLKPGGRLQRLNENDGTAVDAEGIRAEAAGQPQNAISFYRQGRAERIKIEHDLERRGDPHPSVTADGIMQKEGLQIIKRQIGRNFEMTAPLILRGAPLLFPTLLLVLVYSLGAKRYALSLFILPSCALLSFLALMTPLLPRFPLVTHAAAVAALVAMIHTVWRAVVRKDQAPVRPGLPRGGDTMPSI